MVTLSKWAMVGTLVVAGCSAWAQTPASTNDVNLIVKSVQQAYPKLSVLCTGGAEAVRNAVTEAMPSVSKQLKTDAKAAANAAQQRILAGCPY